MICLDNSVLRKLADPDPHPAVLTYLERHAADTWIVPAIIAYEFYSAETARSDIQRLQHELHDNIDDIQAFTDEVAVEAAAIEGALRRQEVTLDTADLLSAATAREAGAAFVTADANDFDRPPLHDLLELDIVHLD